MAGPCGRSSQDTLDAALDLWMKSQVAAVPLLEAQEIACVVGAGGEPGGIEEHEREQGEARRGVCVDGCAVSSVTRRMASWAKVLAHEPFATTGFVALIEQQIERAEDGIEALRQIGGARGGQRKREIPVSWRARTSRFADGGFADEERGTDSSAGLSPQRVRSASAVCTSVESRG